MVTVDGLGTAQVSDNLAIAQNGTVTEGVVFSEVVNHAGHCHTCQPHNYCPDCGRPLKQSWPVYTPYWGINPPYWTPPSYPPSYPQPYIYCTSVGDTAIIN